MDDAALVCRARDGDVFALASLLGRHRHRLVAIGRAMLGDEDAAGDVAQETALIALTELHRLRRPELAGAWLGGIARNLCRRRLRRSARQEWSWDAVHGGQIVRDIIDPDPLPEEIVLRDEVAASVADAVGRLPSGQRDAVQLFYFGGLSYDEVAVALGINVNAVKARLHRARRVLRPLMTPLASRPSRTRREPPMLVEPDIDLTVRDVRRRVIDGREQHVVTLTSDSGDVLPIWIGPSDAIALALRLTSTATPRPLTHDTMARLVQAAAGRITEVRLTHLRDVTFFAEAVVEGADGTSQVDMRPSDALNLALTVGTPIRTTRALLDEVSAGSNQGAHADAGFPDDASAIVADVQQQWARELELARCRHDAG